MAEILGIAASIIQVAGAGTKLATSLYNFTSSALKADQDIRDIASDVELASNALESVGKVFETEDTKSIVSAKAIQDASSIILRCKEVFDDISEIVNKRRTSKKDGKSSLSLMGKLSWPMKEQRVELYRRRLESLKNSLILLLHVLQLAQGQFRGKLEKSAMEEERLKIRELHQRQQDSLQSLQSLEAKLSNVELDDDTTLHGSRVSTLNFMVEPQSPEFPPLRKKFSGNSASSITIDLSAVDDSESSDSDLEIAEEDGEVSFSELERCASHVQKLLKHIMVLQNEMKSQSCVTREDTRRIRKRYKRFRRKFEADMAFQSVRTAAPSSSVSRISQAKKGSKTRAKQRSSSPQKPSFEPAPFETIDTDPNFDLGLNFTDDAGALENFDFDSFLHAGVHDNAFDMGVDFDFNNTAQVGQTTHTQHEVPSGHKHPMALPQTYMSATFALPPDLVARTPSTSQSPMNNTSSPPLQWLTSHPSVSMESNGVMYATHHGYNCGMEPPYQHANTWTPQSSSTCNGASIDQPAQESSTKRGKQFHSPTSYIEKPKCLSIVNSGRNDPAMERGEPAPQEFPTPFNDSLPQGQKRQRSASKDRGQTLPDEVPFVSKGMKRKNVKGLALSAPPPKVDQDGAPRKTRKIEKDIVDILLGEWTVLEA